MSDMLYSNGSVFGGVSDVAKEALNDVTFSDGYEMFLQKLAEKKDIFSTEDKELIVSKFEELDPSDQDWGATMAKQVEIALDGPDDSSSSTELKFIGGLV